MRNLTILPAILAVSTLTAQVPEPRPTISISASGKVTPRADLAIVVLSIHASAPLAVDALDQNTRKMQEVQAKLTSLGYKADHIHFSGNRFSSAGQGMYYPGRERPTGFDVFDNFLVYLDGPDLKDTATLNAKVGTLLDELSKIGAGPPGGPMPASQMGGSLVVFTLKSPEPYEKQAYQQALDKARPLADEIAQRMKVQINGIDGVASAGVIRSMMPMDGPLEEIPYEYLSSTLEEVPVRITVNVRYSYK
jgi:uncharacterized protein YggE